MSTLNSETWQENICHLLLAGHTAHDAAAGVGTDTVGREEAERFAVRALESPLFRAGQQIAVRLRGREWLLAVYAALEELRHDSRTIDQAESIEQLAFVVDYYIANRPLLLPRIAGQWDAVAKWNADYLIKRCGDVKVEVMMGRETASVPHQTSADHLRRAMPFAQYVDMALNGPSSNDLYLVARNRFFDKPDARLLLDDLGDLTFVNTRAASADIKLWLGPAGTVTPLHHDARNNVMVQVIGVKEVRLYSPHHSKHMGQRLPWYAGTDPGLSEDPSQGRSGLASPPEISLILRPGDALFIPVGWWHAVVSLSPSLTLNFHDFGVPNEFPAM